MANNAATTQEFVPIENIRDGIVIVKDGGMRAIVLASSLNFSLKAEDEKTAILAQFQDFVNSLDFSIQIFMQSRKLDIRPYLALLENQKKGQTNSLMKMQIQEYVGFIKAFTENTNIMKKSFFVVIPYTHAILRSKSGGFMNSNKNSDKTADNEDFVEQRTQLEQRVSVVEQGLTRCGVRVARLGTEEIIELFYKIFNPGDTEKPIQMNEQQK